MRCVAGVAARRAPLARSRLTARRRGRQVDPQCLLLYNDYSIDALNKKSKRTHALLAALRDAGAPVHGIGLQAHLSLASPPDLASVRENARRFAALGLQVCISEMDVRVGSSKSASASAPAFALRRGVAARVVAVFAAGTAAEPRRR